MSYVLCNHVQSVEEDLFVVTSQIARFAKSLHARPVKKQFTPPDATQLEYATGELRHVVIS